jgi:SAM-dependent methyltransferase
MYEAEKRVRRFERTYGHRILRPLLAPLWQSAPDPQTGGVWLDWEAGPGLLSLDLLGKLPREATLLASEQDRASLRVLHGHHELERDSRFFVRQDPPEELSLAAAVVDVAIGHWRWQYTAAPFLAMKELARVVRPGGKIVLTFQQPGSGGSLVDAFEKAGAPDIAKAIREDGIPSSTVREALRAAHVQQIEVRTVPITISLGASTRPMMDPLMLDFLLPRWLGKAKGEEITSVSEPEQYDLGGTPLAWDLKAAVAVATIALPETDDLTHSGQRPADDGEDLETAKVPIGRRFE